jgi:peptidoglycan/LPS O-acetylase OafA/YrhL
MMGLGGLIILGVLAASYTTKYDAAVGHAHGALMVPAVGFLALQLFLARAALRLFDDVRSFPHLLDFIVSRFLRYMPAVVPSVLLGFVLINTLQVPGMHAEFRSLPANLLMMADLVGAADIDSSHWRLKIEIIQAVLVAAAWFGPARKHLAVLLTIALIINALSINGEPTRHNIFTVHGFLTNDGYLPLFVFGIALYQFTQDRSSRVWQVMMCAAAALAFLSNTPIHGAVVVAALVALGMIATGGLQALGRWRWLCHLGEIAFPIYVAHYVLGFVIIHRLECLGYNAVVAITAASTAAVAAGKLLNAWFERPLQARGPAVTKAAHELANRWSRLPIAHFRLIARSMRSTGAARSEPVVQGLTP